MTKASLTDRQTMESTPLALISGACSLKPGTCLAEQVGVKAAGNGEEGDLLAGEDLVGGHRARTFRGPGDEIGGGQFISDLDGHASVSVWDEVGIIK